MKKTILAGIVIASALSLNVNAQAEDEQNLINLAPNNAHMSVFNAYCLEDTDAFNIASNLVADGWISYDDVDLIKNPQYRELFNEYSDALQSSGEDIDIYTRELRSGVVFASIHHEYSGCSIMPLSDYTADDILGYLADRNVSAMSIMNKRDAGANISFHLYGDKVISITERETPNGALSHVMSMHLDANVSSAIPEITEEIRNQ
jgi:hypothetical protein